MININNLDDNLDDTIKRYNLYIRDFVLTKEQQTELLMQERHEKECMLLFVDTAWDNYKIEINMLMNKYRRDLKKYKEFSNMELIKFEQIKEEEENRCEKNMVEIFKRILLNNH